MSRIGSSFPETIQVSVPLLALVVKIAMSSAFTAEPPLTGPTTEKRFPPLTVPAGFKATLFACDPLIEYISVIARGPRPGTVFAAHDYMTGLGYDIVRRDEIRLVEDTDGDTYADKSTVYAGGFNSIQGLAFDAGTVYVMHAPFLTSLRDLDGDGVADERRDLLSGLGLPPEENLPRLHCANGVVTGHDGWLYLALGDHGCDVPRPEGDRLVLHGGGILRCRPDGRDFHIFATGLRNIYDVALDEDLNVFVRDNENDGGAYKNRVYHSFFEADHGYPYLYYERPAETMTPLADLGLGSSAGGVCYLEAAYPKEYHGNLFFCEWGRSVVRYGRDRAGSGFAPMKEIEFAAGAENDPYGFKPTDVLVDWDGSLLVSDWADGQRPKRGRGRLYRIRHADQPSFKPVEPGPKTLDTWIAQLDSRSQHARVGAQAALEAKGRDGLKALKQAMIAGKVGVLGRLHAVWVLAKANDRECIDDLLSLADKDPDVRIRAQAVRALADLFDPVFVQHRLEAGHGDSAHAARLAVLGKSADEQVLLELIVALGRMRWPQSPDWLRETMKTPDAALAHAAMQTLRQSKNWPSVLTLLDLPDAAPVRGVALRAIADQADSVLVDGLRQRIQTDPNPLRRREYADVLTRIHRLPGPWVYWGYRPGPRPANSVLWEQTSPIEQALNSALGDADRGVRTATLRGMHREQIPVRLEILEPWLRSERDGESVAAILDSLRDRPAESVRVLCESVVRDQTHSTTNRLTGLKLFLRGLDASSQERLLDLAAALEDGSVLADLLRQLGTQPQLPSRSLLRSKLTAPAPEVRAAALESVGALQDLEAATAVLNLLQDPESRVRQAAALAAGRLTIRKASEPLLVLATDPDAMVRRECLEALRRLREPRVVPLARAALQDGPSQLVAIECLGDLGGSADLDAVIEVASKNHGVDILQAAVRTLTRWQQIEPATSPNYSRLGEAVASVHGSSGLLLRWEVMGPIPVEESARVMEVISHSAPPSGDSSKASKSWQTRLASGTEARVELQSPVTGDTNAVWLAFADVGLPELADAQFLGSSTGAFRVWLNGRSIHQRANPGMFQLDSDRFEARLEPGRNRLVVQVPAQRDARFHLRFRRKSSNTDHERLVQRTLATAGNAIRGRELFLNAEKSACLKCHPFGDLGGRIGPELTGVGGRLSRIYLIESILEPSRAMAPSFENVLVELKDGQLLSGVKLAETREKLTLGDQEGQHEISKAEIVKRQSLALSAMPEGLEKMLTEKEFVDLIAFLVEQK